jgi:hypothetical protein
MPKDFSTLRSNLLRLGHIMHMHLSLRNPFRSTVFSESKNLFVPAALTGNDAYGMRYPYVPYLELFDTEKGKDFDPNKL